MEPLIEHSTTAAGLGARVLELEGEGPGSAARDRIERRALKGGRDRRVGSPAPVNAGASGISAPRPALTAI